MNARRSRVNQIDVILEGSGDGVRERADGLNARAGVRERREIGSKEGIGLVDIGIEQEPVSSRRYGGRDEAMLLKPGMDG